MTFSFPEYPKNWNEMRDAMFSLYGGKYCIKGVFMKFGHDGFINIHHNVPLSKATYLSEYYFLNQPWNLTPLCEKHHKQCHPHMRENETEGNYSYSTYSKSKKVGWARRFGWYLKRKWYTGKFEKRKSDDKILWFWNYWERGKKSLKEEMESWPRQCLEDRL